MARAFFVDQRRSPQVFVTWAPIHPARAAWLDLGKHGRIAAGLDGPGGRPAQRRERPERDAEALEGLVGSAEGLLQAGRQGGPGRELGGRRGAW